MNNPNQSNLVSFSIFVATPFLFFSYAIFYFREYGSINAVFFGTILFILLGTLQMVMLDLRYKIAFWINFVSLFCIGILTGMLILFLLIAFVPAVGAMPKQDWFAAWGVLSIVINFFLLAKFYKNKKYFTSKFNLISDCQKLFSGKNFYL